MISESVFENTMDSVQVTLEKQTDERHVSRGQMDRWFGIGTANIKRASYGERLQRAGLSSDELIEVSDLFRRSLLSKSVPWTVSTVYIVSK